MKKIFLGFIVFTSLILSSFFNSGWAHTEVNKQVLETVVVTPQSDITEWRYKIVNGKIFKRLYNASKQTWIGKWILIE